MSPVSITDSADRYPIAGGNEKMTATSSTFLNGRLTDTVNQQFDHVKPGFVESSESPVMWTPVVAPAAVMAMQASCLSAFC
jgi:hypothetical protein